MCLKYENIDPVKEMIPVRPVIHYVMGGVHTDINSATSLGGLFAAGEVACVSINGANRLGSNSLTELLVFGARAGRSAAAFAKEHQGFGATIESQVLDEEHRLNRLLNSEGTEKIADIRKDMHESMEAGAGIYRSRDTLGQSAEKIRELQERYLKVKVEDTSMTFNTELTSILELGYMLDVAETIIQSALQREESRGSHQRTDHPDRDDEKFLSHSLAYRQDDGSPRIDYLPVTITKWPPGERVYGQKG